jgi:hypothetical protein
MGSMVRGTLYHRRQFSTKNEVGPVFFTKSIPNQMLLHVNYPAIEYPIFRYKDESYQIINVPSLKDMPKSAPQITEMRFVAERRNTAIIENLELYKYENQGISESTKARAKRLERFDKFERTREQAFYCSTLFAATILWFSMRK